MSAAIIAALMIFQMLEAEQRIEDAAREAREALEELERKHPKRSSTIDEHGVEWKDGWWTCPQCSHKDYAYMNYHNRSHCRKCGKLRPGASD